jgi:soluble cytochrome b562
MQRSFFAALFVVPILAAPVWASPVADFENSFGDVYAQYRAALFMTNSGDADRSAKSLEALEAKWKAIDATYRQSPPPQYADDAQWVATLTSVTGYVDKANAEVKGGKLADAHATLESIRDEIGTLHQRNQVETFSDRMNAYHAQMEHVLAADLASLDAAAMRSLLEQAAVLSYLADDVLQTPPPGAADRADYKAQAAEFRAATDAMLAAARSGDAAAVKAAVGHLKAPYSKFLLNFG